jgi:hypothetical protein
MGTDGDSANSNTPYEVVVTKVNGADDLLEVSERFVHMQPTHLRKVFKQLPARHVLQDHEPAGMSDPKMG